MNLINRTKGKKHMINSTDAEKAFDSILHTVIIKAMRKLYIEVKFFNMVYSI